MPPNRWRPLYGALTISDALFGFDQRVTQPLMVALSMIMTNELGGGTPQRLLTKEDHPA